MKSCVRDWKNIKNYLVEFQTVVKKTIFNRRTWIEISIIICLSIFLGIVTNLGLIKRYLAGEFKSAFISQESFPGLVFISLPEAEELWSNRQAIFIDSRSASEYSRGHIPGAISIPLEEVQRGNEEILKILEPPEALVIYCEAGDCQTSLNLAKILYQRGYKNLKIYSGGWAEWIASGNPVEK
ncbi:MAG: rhodanese-like domain-containing protein [Candidatus Saccharicenans sp.]|nr:MAG: hypothetical protein C0168_04705 [Candidatus Aminicenantes bacterium]HEK85570.1 rhodanese-like domain-containing protein [Candidatus Aminicenantes bacterium]